MDEAERRQRAVLTYLAELEARHEELVIRHSGLAWIVEQLLANRLIDEPPDEAEAFLAALSHDDRRSWSRGDEGPYEPSDEKRAALFAYLRSFAGKVRERLREGRRA